MNDTLEIPIFYGLFSVPLWVITDIVTNVSVVVIGHTELTPKHFILITVFIVVTAIRVLIADLRNSEQQPDQTGRKISIVNSVNLKLLELKSVIRELNKTFGVLMFVNTVADMVGVVSLMAFALRTQLEQEENESNEDFQFQKTFASIEASSAYWERGLHVVNSTLRFVAFLGWHVQVRNRRLCSQITQSALVQTLAEMYYRHRGDNQVVVKTSPTSNENYRLNRYFTGI